MTKYDHDLCLAVMERDTLLATLKNAKRVTDANRRCGIAVLQYAKVQGDMVKVTDLDMVLSGPSGMLGNVSVGAAKPFLLPVKDTIDALSMATKGSLVTVFSAGDDRLLIQAGLVESKVVTMSVDDFPTLPIESRNVTGEGLSAAHIFSPGMFSDILKALAPSMSSEETRYYLRGINICGEDDRLTFVATDGHRLGHVKMTDGHCSRWLAGKPVILPREAVTLASKIAMPGAVRLTVTQGWIQIDIGAKPESDDKSGLSRLDCGFSILTKVVDGTFPDYQRLFTKGAFARGFEASCDGLSHACSHMAKTAPAIDVKAQEGKVVSTSGAALGVDFGRSAGLQLHSVGVNPAYLDDIAKACRIFSQRMSIRTTDDLDYGWSPLSVMPTVQPEFGNVQFLLMPIRL
jgi:DNA polymerase III sliding clamp (beta) subunit (PCNA family)